MSWLAAIDDEQWQRSMPSSFSSVRQTSIHIASAEKIWIDFWKGITKPVYLSSEFTGTKDELITIWQEINEDQFNFVRNYDELKLNLPVDFVYPNGRIGQMP